MSLSPPVAVTIRAGEEEINVPLCVLAAVFRVPQRELHARLVALVADVRRRTREGETTEGERIDRSIPKEYKTPLRSIEGIGGAGERGAPLAPEALATLLGDAAGLVALRRLVSGVPDEIVREALARTLAVPPERITKSRAAYFSTVLRELRRAQSTP